MPQDNGVIYALMLSILQACPVAPFDISELIEAGDFEKLNGRNLRFIYYCQLQERILQVSCKVNFPLYHDLQDPYDRLGLECANPRIVDMTWTPRFYGMAPLVGAGKPDWYGIVRLCQKADPGILSRENGLRQLEYFIEACETGLDLEVRLALWFLREKKISLDDVLSIVASVGRWKEEHLTSFYLKVLDWLAAGFREEKQNFARHDDFLAKIVNYRSRVLSF